MYYVVGMSPFAQKEQNIEDIFLQKKAFYFNLGQLL